MDDAKAASNLAKHGVTFNASVVALAAPGAVIRPDDDRYDYGEPRWIVLAETENTLWPSYTQDARIASASFPPERRTGMSTIRTRNPKLTAADLKALERLRDMPDSEIDYSDIPATDAAFWADAIWGPIGKEKITIRLDSAVLEWFRREPRYQSRINEVLRTFVVHEQRQAREAAAVKPASRGKKKSAA